MVGDLTKVYHHVNSLTELITCSGEGAQYAVQRPT